MKNKREILREILSQAGELRSSGDVEGKVVIPFLKKLGYEEKDFRMKFNAKVVVGTREVRVEADFLVRVSVKGFSVMVIDAKHPKEKITSRDILQVRSYAVLIEAPHIIPLIILTNGNDWKIRNVITNEVLDIEAIPTKEEAGEILKMKREATESQILDAQRTLITIASLDQFKAIFSECKNVLKSHEGLLPEEAFDEMSKVIVCKLYEERRGLLGEKDRFTCKSMEEWGYLRALDAIFEEAKRELKIFGMGERLSLKQEFTAKRLVELLEPFSLHATGENVTGAVYETFLSETLRGELGQYFTPRQIVEFMVDLIDPKIGEKILDPACGSGGFLVTSFIKLREKIRSLPLSKEERERYENRLINELLWGIDLSPRLAALCRLNLLIHGDGYNNIYQGDTIRGGSLVGSDGIIDASSLENTFDVILTNPPFDFTYDDPLVLRQYELTSGKKSGSTDVLFLEKCVKLLKEGGRFAIVLPYGMISLPGKYGDVIDFMKKRMTIKALISLPVGVFKPFGGSNAKTCILVAEKRKPQPEDKIFMAIANAVGFAPGYERYKEEDNDLPLLAEEAQRQEKNINEVKEVGHSIAFWINHNELEDILSPEFYYRKKIEVIEGKEEDKLFEEVADILHRTITPKSKKYRNKAFVYINVDDIDESTGTLKSYTVKQGKDIPGSKTIFRGGDILLARIRPSIDNKKICIVPDWITEGVGSSELYVIRPKDGVDKYHLLWVLRQDQTIERMIITTGTSGRQRIDREKLKKVKIPLLPEKIRESICRELKQAIEKIYEARHTLETLKQIWQP